MKKTLYRTSRLKSLGLLAMAGLSLMAVNSSANAAQNQGEELYQYYCAQCHGEKANGKGINATEDLPTQPKDFTSPKNLPAFTDEQIVNTIRHGGPKEQLSFIMPPWGEILSDKEIELLKVELRKICKCQYDPAVAAAAAAEKAKNN
jgi:cytochrome c oxidase cbb3-type subunit III